MTGKINIVFGFFYLAFTAVLGPAFLVPQLYERGAVMKQTAQSVADVRDALAEPHNTDGGLMEKNAVALQGLLEGLKAQQIRGTAAHAHGNLEAVLNIVAGILLLSLVIPKSFESLLSLLFIVGAVFHSGMLYLGSVFGIGTAFKLLLLGEVALIGGIALMGVAAVIGLKSTKRC